MKRKGGLVSTIIKWIVILAVIGFFGLAMLMPLNCGGSASAEASNVISDLRNCKGAALMYFEVDKASPDIFPPLAPNVNTIERIIGYTGNPERYISNRYMFYVKGDVWWVGYRLKNSPANFFWDWLFGDGEWIHGEVVREKLEGKAGYAGLYGTSDPTVLPASSDLAGLYKKEDAAVWMRAR